MDGEEIDRLFRGEPLEPKPARELTGERANGAESANGDEAPAASDATDEAAAASDAAAADASPPIDGEQSDKLSSNDQNAARTFDPGHDTPS